MSDEHGSSPGGDHAHDHHPDHEHDHEHGHHHGHGHANDQGLSGALRYLRFAPEMWRSAINEAAVELLAPAAGDRVVDIGAGMGAGTTVLARSGASVVAVEPTPFLRRVLSFRRGLRRDRGRIEVVDGAAERLPLADGEATAVLAVNTMHHWVDLEQAVAEIARVLGPAGRAVLVDEDFDDPAHPDHDRFGSSGDGHEHHGFTMVDGDRMATLLTSAGLDRVEASRRILDNRPVVAVIVSPVGASA